MHSTEVMGSVGFDFIVVDQEHAPFDRLAIDSVILACRAVGMSALVRVGDPSPANILNMLDCGAAGVMVPHVENVEIATRIAAACRYRNGKRGFSRTGRAGGYGSADVGNHIASQDAQTLCIAMIEDVGAIDRAEAIASVEGIDAIFVGRGDLSAAMGELSSNTPNVWAAVKNVAEGTRRAGKPMLFVAENPADRNAMTDLGGSAYLVGSDLAFLRRAAIEALA
ncbi:HpcH/HpaI aldolase family protein [Pelagibacterium limicola]|uniref:HpcH/HpaI aldolase family protein n=1 Tax=Pelagibacterium limicola TaxID=2791022 RepID=UPI0031B63F35